MAAKNPHLLVSSLKSLQLDLPPSCVEFSPLHSSYFLVGTYYLEKDDAANVESADTKQLQNRTGSVVTFQLTETDITLIQTVQQPSAVLDMHFQVYAGRQHICGVVSSTASLNLFSFDPVADASCPLKPLGLVHLPGVGDEVLFLSFCWLPHMPDAAAITTSTGSVYITRLQADYQSCCAPAEAVITHSLEAWCVAVASTPTLVPSHPLEELANADSPFTLLSGGDDSLLRYRTCTMAEADKDTTSVQLPLASPFPSVQVRGHDAGVTAILPLPRKEGSPNLIVTGSYDDHIRLFAITPLHESGGLRSTQLLAEADLGGGVWRLKLVQNQRVDESESLPPKNSTFTILASCMHAGARVVELLQSNAGDFEFRLRARFEEHQSMNYGSDAQPRTLAGMRVVSTSFYDKLLCLWEVE